MEGYLRPNLGRFSFQKRSQITFSQGPLASLVAIQVIEESQQGIFLPTSSPPHLLSSRQSSAAPEDNKGNLFKWNILYDEKDYYKKPYVIKKFIEFNKYFGIEILDDLKYFNSLK